MVSSPTASLALDRASARRFALLATGLVESFPSVATALAHHGFIQIDPINVCGRMHELIARPRVSGYQEQDLHRHLHGLSEDAPAASPCAPAETRTAFEHFHPARAVLAAFPLDAWPYLHPLMARRARTPGQWAGKLRAEESRLATRILAEIADRGPLASEAIDHDARADNGWNQSRLAKVVMDKLFAHGRLLIARRQQGRRVYDLPERVLPAAILATRRPAPGEQARWNATLKLRQHRLVTLTRDELPWVDDLVLPLAVPDCPRLFCLRSDRPLLEAAQAATFAEPTEARLLAPLDPLIVDRRLTRHLWEFDYTWEVYTPPAKRRRGYYALPVITGQEFVGDVDLKADRTARHLQVVSQRIARGHTVATRRAVSVLAEFLRLPRIIGPAAQNAPKRSI